MRTLAVMPGLTSGVGLVNSMVTLSPAMEATAPESASPPSSPIWIVAGIPGRRAAVTFGSGDTVTESRPKSTAI